MYYICLELHLINTSLSAPKKEAECSSETSKTQPNHFVVMLLKRKKNENAVKALNYHPKRKENFYR
jgi:hypothetical protein